LESKESRTYLGAPAKLSGPEEMGPDVMNPVAGIIGEIGPEFCRTIGSLHQMYGMPVRQGAARGAARGEVEDD